MSGEQSDHDKHMSTVEVRPIGPNDGELWAQAEAAEDRRRNTFREGLRELINRTCRENGSDTPDYILASYLEQSLAAFDDAVNHRRKWYNSK